MAAGSISPFGPTRIVESPQGVRLIGHVVTSEASLTRMPHKAARATAPVTARAAVPAMSYGTGGNKRAGSYAVRPEQWQAKAEKKGRFDQ